MISVIALSKVIADQTIPLDSLDLKNVVQEWGEARASRSVDNNPLSIGGQKFAHGVGTHANGSMVIPLKGTGLKFVADVGVDDEVKERGSVQFVVMGDGKTLFKSKVLKGGSKPEHIEVSLAKVKTLTLQVSDGGDGNDYDHADWAEAYISTTGSNSLQIVGAPSDPALKIYTDQGQNVEINGPRVMGCSPGKPFFFHVPVTGSGNVRVTVDELPTGLTYDAENRVVQGAIPTEGEYAFSIRASNGSQKAHRRMKVICGFHKLALTPPMGWNSWNVWGTSVTATRVQAAADSFLNTGLADYGYRYVNIDDAWEGKRDENGEIVTNEKFGDISKLANYCHLHGLGLGIYSSPGEQTCAGYAGSYDHEVQDAVTYGKWGVDYLKYDWCSYGNKVPRNPSLEQMKAPYIKMRGALDQSSRDIVFSLCQYGMGDVYKWGKEVGGNLWRTTGDINDSFSSMSGIAFQHDVRAFGASPGGWNDPDMLVVGKLGWGDHPRQTHLSANEQIMHITMWSMLAAPMLLGCDLTKLDAFTKALITNHDAIDIDQDPLGKAARRVFATPEGVEVWSRPLWDGTTAVAVMNRNSQHANITLTMQQLHLEGRQPVLDVWSRKKLGSKSRIEVSVPIHGAQMFRIGHIKD